MDKPKTTPTTGEMLRNGKGKEIPEAVKASPSGFVDIEKGIEDTPKENHPLPDQPIIEPPKPLKIALIGTAPSSRMLAPFSDPSWTIWACSPGNQDIPRADAWFEVHANLLWPENVSYGQPYVDWLNSQTFPVYMQDQRLVPRATVLPIGELVNEFGKFFFTSSFAYMLAMAIKAGAQEIALFGIDMASKDEYILQRPGGHFFIQEAAKRGIKVSVPYESDLAQPPELYGYADSTPFGRKIHVRRLELVNRLSAMKQQRDQLVHSITFLEGAVEDIDYIKSIWGGIQT